MSGRAQRLAWMSRPHDVGDGGGAKLAFPSVTAQYHDAEALLAASAEPAPLDLRVKHDQVDAAGKYSRN